MESVIPGSDPETRVRTLLYAAAAAFSGEPRKACDWLHTPHASLLGISPASAAWRGVRLAELAHRLLSYDARRLYDRSEATPNHVSVVRSTHSHFDDVWLHLAHLQCLGIGHAAAAPYGVRASAHVTGLLSEGAENHQIGFPSTWL